MTVVARVAEGVARGLIRREVVARGAAAIFGVAAAWTTQGPFGSAALAERCRPRDPRRQCHPLGIGYCTTLDETFCEGARCAGGCTYDTTGGYSTACWCTATGRHGRDRRAYYKCCDCTCPDGSGGVVQCACRRLVVV